MLKINKSLDSLSLVCSYYEKNIFVFFIALISSITVSNANETDSISYKVTYEKNMRKIVLFNHSKDTLFLFDTYLENLEFTENKIFYRYKRKKNTCVLSFLPMVPYLVAVNGKTNVNVQGEKSVVSRCDYAYHFIKLYPNDSSCVPVRFIHHGDGVYKYINMYKYSQFNKEIKFRESKIPDWYNVCVEFAIYKNVNLLQSEYDYFNNEKYFNRQALSYDILTIPLGIRGVIH